MRRMWTHLALLAVAIGGAPSCRNDPAGLPREFDLVVETDQPRYSVATDRVARVTLTNRSSRDVYLPMNSYVVYERRRDGEWRDAAAWFIVDGIGPSFAVPPEDAHTDELDLSFYLPNHPGTYRFRYLVYADPEVTSLLPLGERVSPPFELAPQSQLIMRWVQSPDVRGPGAWWTRTTASRTTAGLPSYFSGFRRVLAAGTVIIERGQVDTGDLVDKP